MAEPDWNPDTGGRSLAEILREAGIESANRAARRRSWDDPEETGIRQRREAGHADTMRALWRQPWIGKFGLLDGVILHEPEPGAEPAAEIEPAEPCSGSVPDYLRKLAAE